MTSAMSQETPPTGAGPLPADAAGRLYAALAATNEAILRANSRDELYQRVCAAALHGGEFMSAAIWLPSADGSRLQLETVAGSREHLEHLQISTDPSTPEGRGPTGLAFATQRSVVVNDAAAELKDGKWRLLIARYGIASLAAVPLAAGERSIAVLQLASLRMHAFDEATLRLVERMAENIVFALGHFERREAMQRAERRLVHFRETLDTAVDALYLTDRRTMRFLDANRTACERTGYTLDELLQRGPRDIVDSETDDLEARLDEVIAQWPYVVVSEEVARDRHGRQRYVELHRRAVRSGDDWLVVSSARDITGRRRDESLLRLEHAVTCLLAEAHSLRRTLGMVSRLFCESEGWLSGGYFRAESADGASRLIAGWDQPAQDGRTRRANERLFDSLQPPGGTISVCIVERRPVWVPDIAAATDAWSHSRHHLERLEHTSDRSRFNFPVMVGGVAIGAMSFTTNQTREPDERLLLSVRVIGDQIGQFVRRKQAEQTLRASEERFRGLTELSSDWYWEQDDALRFSLIGGGREASPEEQAHRALGLGMTLWEIPAVVSTSADFDGLQASVGRHERYRDFEFALRAADGTLRWLSISGEPVHDERGRFAGYRGVARDITERRETEARIQHLANHDALTGLPNRVMFGGVLTRAIDYARRYRSQFAVLFLDLDRFKVINDTLGHDAGDELLKEIARRVLECVRASDVFARLGGDEFVVLLQNIAEEGEIALVANKILGATARPVFVRGHECRITASVGICRYPLDAEDEQSLMKGADIAMYRAKQDGKNNFRFHSPDIRTRSLERLQMETHLRRALDRGEFSLHYQPKVELARNEVVGVEALLRWNSAELGAVSPVDFIGLAEETGLILSIGKWVLRTACLQNVAWQRDGLPAISVAVNLSARQFADPDLLDDLANVLCESGLAPDLLNLEITESMVAQDAAGAVKLLQAIRETGVKLSIDDFGTGYSSLAQLKRFPLDALKIDRSFIRDIPGDPEDAAIAQAIIAMGKTLQLTVVAEGVETPAQEAFLRANRCDQMQGYLFSRPLPADALATLWREHLARTKPATIEL